MNFLGLDLYTWAFLVVFVGVLPWMGRFGIASLRRALEAGDHGARLREYRRTILIQWGLNALFLGTWLFLGRGLDEIGLVPRAAGWEWVALVAAAILTTFVVWQSHQAAGRPEELRRVRRDIGSLDVALPHTEAELRGFNALSITAGICEEILYRGLLMSSLAAAFGLWPAVLLSSLVFGLGHSYQGPKGILRTGAVGLGLALVVVFTGSLFAAIFMHAILDLAQGKMIRAAVNLEDDKPGLQPATGVYYEAQEAS